MADEKFKYMDKDVEALLNIIREKDNLIVSLKEASTRRDKLNEQQIRMLAEDNSRKLMEIKTLQSRLKELDAKLAQREAELSLFKVTEDKLSSKVEEFKVAFEKYRNQVRAALDQIKLSIQEELSRREDYKNKMLDEMKNNYLRLEAQLQELDNYYKEIIADISKKQGLAKKYIRHALNDLQEALSLLDLAHSEFIQPTKIKEDFSRLIEESNALFQEFKEMKGLPEGTTLIKNIENVNIKLGSAPQIEGIFEEIYHITESARQHIESAAKTSLTGVRGESITDVKGAHLKSSAKPVGVDTKGSMVPDKSSREAAGAGKEHEREKPGAGYKDKAGGKTGGGADSDALSEKMGAETKKGVSDNLKRSADSGGESKTIEESGKDKGGMGASITDERSESEEKEKKLGEDVQEVIFKRGRNYAPFNWQAILTDIQLKRFQSFIQSCIKAEKEGNLLKALELYKTIREQPGISETIAGKLLDDHIEYLEDLIKRKYSVNYS